MTVLRDLLIRSTAATVRELDGHFAAFARAILARLPDAPTFTLREFVAFQRALIPYVVQMFGASPATALRSTLGQALLTRITQLRDAVARHLGLTPAGTDPALTLGELSTRIWQQGQQVRFAIERTLRDGIARGESSEIIAGRLARFVKPSYAKARYYQNGRIVVEPGAPPNAINAARRLARTELSRTHGEAVKDAVRRTPGMAVKWSLGSHKRSDECDRWANGSSDGLPRGVYLVDEVPRFPSHPNCLCLIEPYSLKGGA